MRVHQFKPWRWLELDPCGVFMTYWIIIFLRAKMCLPQIWIFVCWSYEKCCRGDDPCNFSIRVCQIEIFASLLVPQVPFGSIGAKKSPPRCFQAQRSFRSMAFCSLLALLPFASAGGGPMACASRYLHGGLLKRLQSTSHLLSEMKMESKQKLMVWRWCFVPTREFSGCRWNTSEACNSKCFVWRWSRLHSI